MMRKLTFLESTIFPPDNTLATCKARHATHAEAHVQCTDCHNWQIMSDSWTGGWSLPKFMTDLMLRGSSMNCI